MTPASTQRENRALCRLHREPVLKRTQLWHIGAGNRTIDALVQAGAITTNGEHLSLTEQGRALWDERLRTGMYATYGGGD